MERHTLADDDAAFLVLAERASASIAELVDETGIEEPRMQAAVENLSKQDLVVRVPGEPARYAPAATEVVWERWLDEQEHRLESARRIVRALAMRPPYSTGDFVGADFVELVSGQEAILRRFAELQATLRSQVRAVDKPPYAMVEGGHNLAREQELLNKGIRWRAIYDPTGLKSLYHRLGEDMQPSIAAGEEARVFADLPIKMVIFDDRAAIIPVESRPQAITSAAIVHPSALFDALTSLFELLWSDALPLHLPGGVQEPSPHGPNPGELQLLGLLTAGLTDEVIARHLGVSVRTVHRRLSALQERLRARTRFQAALHAVRQGWLPAEADGSITGDSAIPDDGDRADPSQPQP